MRFTCRRYETRGRSGELASIGIVWTEARAMTEAAIDKLADWIAYAAALGGFVGLCFSLLDARFLLAVLAAAVVLGFAWGLTWLGWRVPGVEYALEFHADGTTSAPIGLSTGRLKNKRSRHSNTSIISIEAERILTPKPGEFDLYTHGVRIFHRDGAVNHIAQNLGPDDAHKLAVTLTHALRALRRDVAEGSGTTQTREVNLID